MTNAGKTPGRSGVYEGGRLTRSRRRTRLWLIASGKETKLPACSWLSGDALANEVFSPCAVQEKAYLYGLNSTYLAASAADNYDSKFVACEMFRDYARINAGIVFKEFSLIR